ncbi:MAG: hypothetical protein U0487_03210 [Patescibacteria group bacterium]
MPTVLAVPSYSLMGVEEGEAYLEGLSYKDQENDLERNGGFYTALNVYLASTRTAY